MKPIRKVRRTSHEVVELMGQSVENFSRIGRRYARWHLWRDKLVYIFVFFIFIVWLEWTIHSQVFPLEERTVKSQQQIFPQVRGRCGPRFTLPSGAPTKCEAGVATCCSARGWCTNAPDDCLCDDCIYYEWEEAQKLLPTDLPLVDDRTEH